MKIIDRKSTSGIIVQNTTLNLFSKFLTYVTFAIVAYKFGAQSSTDIYYLGTSFATSCTGIFVIVISSVFSPILIRIKIKNSITEARLFAGSFFCFTVLFLLFFCVVLFIFPVHVFSIISKFSTNTLTSNKMMLAFFAIVILFTVISEFGRIYIESLGFFSIVSYISALQASVLIIMIFVLAGIFKLFALVLALCISLVIQCLLWYFFCKSKGVLPILNIYFNKLHIELLKTSTPLIAAHFITVLIAYLMDYIASGLSAGSLTAITFATKIYTLPLLLLFNPALEVINTKFSEYYHTDIKLLSEKYVQLQRFFIMLLTPFMIILFFFRLEIVKIFFLRGAFGIGQANVTANCLGVFVFTTVSFCMLSVIARIYFIMQKTGWSSFYGAIGQILTVLLAYVLSNKYGYIAIPMAKVICELLYLVPISFWLVNKYLPNNFSKELLIPFLNLLTLCFVLGYGFYRFFILVNNYSISTLSHNMLREAVIVSFSIVLFVLTYFFALLKFKFPEMELLMRKVRNLKSI